MAEKLVTQVRNPEGTSGDDALFVDVQPNEEDLKAHPPSACCARCSVWWGDCLAACLSCFSCLPCCRPDPRRAERGRRRLSIGARGGRALLPPQKPGEKGKKTLILDLDETLVHSSFKPVANADFVLSIELEDETHHVYVLKRPGVDEFLRAAARRWEIVVFTASLSKYADPLLDILDADGLVSGRLFREACVQHYGNFVKDLSLMGREMRNLCIIDNSPYSYIFQPDNALAVTSWFHDSTDRQLYDLIPIMDQLAEARDVAHFLANGQHVLLRQHNERVEQAQLMQQRLMNAQLHAHAMPAHTLAGAPRAYTPAAAARAHGQESTSGGSYASDEASSSAPRRAPVESSSSARLAGGGGSEVEMRRGHARSTSLSTLAADMGGGGGGGDAPSRPSRV